MLTFHLYLVWAAQSLPRDFQKETGSLKCRHLRSGVTSTCSSAGSPWEFLLPAKGLDVYDTGVFLWAAQRR